MTRRTTNRDLEGVVAVINRMTGHTFTLGYAYGGVRLEDKNGSVDVSPRLTRGQMLDWLHAFKDGLEHAKEKGTRNPPRRKAKAKSVRTRGKVVGSFGDPRKIARAKFGPTQRQQSGETAFQFRMRQEQGNLPVRFARGNRVTLRSDRADAYGLPRGAVYTVLRTYPHRQFKRTWVVIDAPKNPDGTDAVVDSRELRLVAEHYGHSNPRKKRSSGRRSGRIRQSLRRTRRNPAQPSEGPGQNIRNAMQMIDGAGFAARMILARKVEPAVARYAEEVRQSCGDAFARLLTALKQVEKGVRGNPLAIFGANPPRVKTVRVLGRVMQIRYKRNDDGKFYRHDFKARPRLLALSDGTIAVRP